MHAHATNFYVYVYVQINLFSPILYIYLHVFEIIILNLHFIHLTIRFEQLVTLRFSIGFLSLYMINFVFLSKFYTITRKNLFVL